MTKQIAELESKIEKGATESNQNQRGDEKVSQLNTRIESLTMQYTSTVASLEAQITRLKEDASKANIESISLKAANAEATKAKESLVSKCTALEAQTERLSSQVAVLASDHSSSEAEIENLKSTKTKLVCYQELYIYREM